MIKVFKYRLYPTQKLQTRLQATLDLCRELVRRFGARLIPF